MIREYYSGFTSSELNLFFNDASTSIALNSALGSFRIDAFMILIFLKLFS